MGTPRPSQAAADRKSLDPTLNTMIQIFKTQREGLHILAKEKKTLEDHIKMQHERWVSDVRLYEDHIVKMHCELLLEKAKSELMFGSKHGEASLLKVKLEHSDDELADFKAWFDLLRGSPKIQDSGSKSLGSKMLEGEVKRLKLECDKLASEKKSEVSALLAEKDFVWHQLKLLENELTNKLKSKNAEVDQANKKIAELLGNVEQLQSSNNEQDELIARLKTKVSEMEDSGSKSLGSKMLEGEVKRLKLECDKLASEKKSEVSALLAEKDSVWHQLKLLENELTDKLKSKNTEVDQANKKVAELLGYVEKFQSSNNEKDELVARLKTKVSEMEAGTNEEISRLSQELELLRKSRSASVTPVLNRCSSSGGSKSQNISSRAGARTTGSSKNIFKYGSNVVVKKESSGTQVPEGSRSLKRKDVDVITISETPKLFNSKFKVPKLKVSSPSR